VSSPATPQYCTKCGNEIKGYFSAEAEDNLVSEFIVTECVLGPNLQAVTTELKSALDTYCKRTNQPIIDERQLGKALSRRGLIKTQKRQGSYRYRVYLVLALKGTGD
jgi:hypothetical protein